MKKNPKFLIIIIFFFTFSSLSNHAIMISMTKKNLLKGERIDQLFSTDVKIIQNKEVFSYSADSVLLTRFPKFPCSGNGTVGLFASTQTKDNILEIELQERLANMGMSQRSIELNGLAEQVKASETSKKNASQHYLLAR